jgi:hypothetical protein
MEITFNGGKVVTAKINDHLIITDQPIDNGGTNTAPASFDLYLASKGTCAVTKSIHYPPKFTIITSQI